MKSRFRVLIVDDDAAILQMLSTILKNEGYVVSTAASGAQAIAALQQDSFDLVVTDMRMESSTAGFDVIKTAKAQQQQRPVVILTAYPLSASDWRPSGADKLFMKGSDSLDRMLSDLKQLVERRRRT